jgi:hypothetical protein
MNFKEYFLYRESPDEALILLDRKKLLELENEEYREHVSISNDSSGNEIHLIRFTNTYLDPITFISFNNFVYYASTNNSWHKHLSEKIIDATIDATNYIEARKILEEEGSIFGTFGESDFLFLKKLAIKNENNLNKLTTYLRSPFLKTILSGRTWKLTPEVSLISLWQTVRDSEFKVDIRTKRLLIEFMKYVYPSINKSKILFDPNTVNVVVPFFKNSSKIKTQKITRTDDEIPIHQLSPEKKKEALLNMGAKPKTPIGIMNKREGD